MTWVSDVPFSEMQRDTLAHRTPGTGNWLLESKEYVDWKTSPGSVLWLPGVGMFHGPILISFNAF